MSTSPLPNDGQTEGTVQSEQVTIVQSEQVTIVQSEQVMSEPRDAAYWSRQISALKVSSVPSGALNLNVDGKLAVGPLQGFGQMWQKTYRIHLTGTKVDPKEVIQTWKNNFPRYWPKGNRFYAPLTGIAPGEVALLNIKTAGVGLSTGVLVLYADDESFTLMTPQGHVFAGWITFSSYTDSDGVVAQAQLLIRANDPIYELGMRFGGSKQENKFWQHTLAAIGADFGATGPVQTEIVCIDPRLQWSQMRNVWHNAAVRTTIYRVTAPLRWIRGGRARTKI